MHAALLLPFVAPPFQRTVFGYLRSIRFQRGHQCIIDSRLHVIGIQGIARYLQQAVAKLHPGKGHARFHRVVSRLCLPFLPAIPAFERAARSGHVNLFTYDMPDRLFHDREIKRVACYLVEFEQPLVARHHFIRFLSVLPRKPGFRMRETVGHGHIGNGFADQLRTAGGLPLSDDILGKIKITFLFRPVIEIHDRFEDGRTRHADIIAGRDDIHLSGPDLRHQMVDHFASRLQCFLILRQIIPGDQPQ